MKQNTTQHPSKWKWVGSIDNNTNGPLSTPTGVLTADFIEQQKETFSSDTAFQEDFFHSSYSDRLIGFRHRIYFNRNSFFRVQHN